MSNLSREVKERLRVAREQRITVASVAENGMRSRRSILGYRKGYTMTREALDHSYNARVGSKI